MTDKINAYADFISKQVKQDSFGYPSVSGKQGIGVDARSPEQLDESTFDSKGSVHGGNPQPPEEAPKTDPKSLRTAFGQRRRKNINDAALPPEKKKPDTGKGDPVSHATAALDKNSLNYNNPIQSKRRGRLAHSVRGDDSDAAPYENERRNHINHAKYAIIHALSQGTDEENAAAAHKIHGHMLENMPGTHHIRNDPAVRNAMIAASTEAAKGKKGNRLFGREGTKPSRVHQEIIKHYSQKRTGVGGWLADQAKRTVKAATTGASEVTSKNPDIRFSAEDVDYGSLRQKLAENKGPGTGQPASTTGVSVYSKITGREIFNTNNPKDRMLKPHREAGRKFVYHDNPDEKKA